MLYVNCRVVISNMKKADVMRAWHMTVKYSTHLRHHGIAFFPLLSQVWITKWALSEMRTSRTFNTLWKIKADLYELQFRNGGKSILKWLKYKQNRQELGWCSINNSLVMDGCIITWWSTLVIHPWILQSLLTHNILQSYMNEPFAKDPEKYITFKNEQ